MTVYKLRFRVQATGREFEETFESALARALFVISWSAHVDVLREWEAHG